MTLVVESGVKHQSILEVSFMIQEQLFYIV